MSSSSANATNAANSSQHSAAPSGISTPPATIGFLSRLATLEDRDLSDPFRTATITSDTPPGSESPGTTVRGLHGLSSTVGPFGSLTTSAAPPNDATSWWNATEAWSGPISRMPTTTVVNDSTGTTSLPTGESSANSTQVDREVVLNVNNTFFNVGHADPYNFNKSHSVPDYYTPLEERLELGKHIQTLLARQESRDEHPLDISTSSNGGGSGAPNMSPPGLAPAVPLKEEDLHIAEGLAEAMISARRALLHQGTAARKESAAVRKNNDNINRILAEVEEGSATAPAAYTQRGNRPSIFDYDLTGLCVAEARKAAAAPSAAAAAAAVTLRMAAAVRQQDKDPQPITGGGDSEGGPSNKSSSSFFSRSSNHNNSSINSLNESNSSINSKSKGNSTTAPTLTKSDSSQKLNRKKVPTEGVNGETAAEVAAKKAGGDGDQQTLQLLPLTPEILKKIPIDEETGLPLSVGSIGHVAGTCKPCVFFRTSSKVCNNGIQCPFCHYPHPPKKRYRASRRRRAEARAAARAAAAAAAAAGEEVDENEGDDASEDEADGLQSGDISDGGGERSPALLAPPPDDIDKFHPYGVARHQHHHVGGGVPAGSVPLSSLSVGGGSTNAASRSAELSSPVTAAATGGERPMFVRAETEGSVVLYRAAGGGGGRYLDIPSPLGSGFHLENSRSASTELLAAATNSYFQDPSFRHPVTPMRLSFDSTPSPVGGSASFTFSQMPGFSHPTPQPPTVFAHEMSGQSPGSAHLILSPTVSTAPSYPAYCHLPGPTTSAAWTTQQQGGPPQPPTPAPSHFFYSTPTLEAQQATAPPPLLFTHSPRSPGGGPLLMVPLSAVPPAGTPRGTSPPGGGVPHGATPDGLVGSPRIEILRSEDVVNGGTVSAPAGLVASPVVFPHPRPDFASPTATPPTGSSLAHPGVQNAAALLAGIQPPPQYSTPTSPSGSVDLTLPQHQRFAQDYLYHPASGSILRPPPPAVAINRPAEAHVGSIPLEQQPQQWRSLSSCTVPPPPPPPHQKQRGYPNHPPMFAGPSAPQLYYMPTAAGLPALSDHQPHAVHHTSPTTPTSTPPPMSYAAMVSPKGEFLQPGRRRAATGVRSTQKGNRGGKANQQQPNRRERMASNVM